MRHLGSLLLLLALAMVAGAANIPWLLVPDSSLVDADWPTDAGAVGWAFETPNMARIVGNEIRVADQVADAIHRSSPGRSDLGSLTRHHLTGVALDDLRGFGEDGSSVFLAVYSGATPAGRGSVVDDTAGNPTGFLPGTGSDFDAQPFQGDLLVSDTGGNAVHRWTLAGADLGDFAALAYPEQGEVLVDGCVLVGNAIDSAGLRGIDHCEADGSLRLSRHSPGLHLS